LKIGSVFDNRWKIVDICGKGGQGQVYKVVDNDNPTLFFALKILHKQKDEERRARMYTEVFNLERLSNDHLSKIVFSNIDNIKKGDALYYVSPYINGCTLESFVNKEEISFDRACSFFDSLLRVISYCHGNDIIHRDIKPDNIVLEDSELEKFVLIDFGLSFNMEDQDTITQTNQQLGNRFLLLPELVSGDSKQNRRCESDLSQACGVFFYVLTGLIPKSLSDGEGQAPHKRAKAVSLLEKKISNRTMLQDLNRLFDRAFNNNLSNRFHSAEEVRKELRIMGESREQDMAEIIVPDSDNSENSIVEVAKFKYTDLMRQLNPSEEFYNPAGLNLPMETNVVELLIGYGEALPQPVKEKVARYYRSGDYATSASHIWQRAVSLLRKRVLSLGEEFVADMVETDDLDYARNLPAYRVIDLANDLGFIDKAGKRKLLMANDYYNYYNNSDIDEYEEMPQDEANIIIKNSISYILYNTDETFGLQFNDFREKLKTGKVTELFDDDKSMFETCPYFYLKTTVRSLLKLFGETDGIEYENVTSNMIIVFPACWDRLKIEERRALADAYTDYTNANDHVRVKLLNGIMLKVQGFDYVKENVRSRTYISVARRLRDVHFDINNYYTEPGVIKQLEDLGTTIPKLALKECVTSILYVKLGNGYGVSWKAEEVADRLLDRMTQDQWLTYIDNYMVEETDLIESIRDCNPMRDRWKELIKRYSLKSLNVLSPVAGKLVSIK